MAENETDSNQIRKAAPPSPTTGLPVRRQGRRRRPGDQEGLVEIPEERIQQKLAEQFKELRSQAAIPGFRVGHAPQKLIEKRFASDVKEQVRRSLVSESYEQAIEKNKLQPIGEPEFENQPTRSSSPRPAR